MTRGCRDQTGVDKEALAARVDLEEGGGQQRDVAAATIWCSTASRTTVVNEDLVRFEKPLAHVLMLFAPR